MIKYTGTDIIKRAEQLSDLENSEFISDNEKLALLNEAFQMLYQKVIDANDKVFTKTVYAKSGMTLPLDFYQMTGLWLEQNKEPIAKINHSQKRGYEINTNKLYLSKEYNGLPVVMEYAVIPPTIFIREKTVDSPYINNPITTNGKLYAYYNDNNGINFADCDDDTNIETDITADDIAIFENGAVIEKDSSYSIFDFENTVQLENGEIPLIYHNSIYVYKNNKVYDITKQKELYSVELDIEEGVKILYTDKLRLYQIADNFYKLNDYDKVEITLPLQARLLEGLYTVSNKKLVVLFPKEYRTITTEFPVISIVNDIYALTKKSFGNQYKLEGLRESTFLDYPNNLFFTTLAYMLAIQFKIKQSADITELSAVYDTVLEQFYSSLNRDANQYYQIRNVYSMRGF